MNLRWLIPPVLTIAGFAVGFVQGFPEVAPQSTQRLGTATANSSDKTAPENGTPREFDGAVRLKAGLFRAIGVPSRGHRIHDLKEWLASLSLDELRAVAALIGELPSYCQRDVQGLLALRLLELDPNEAAHFVEKERDISLGYLLLKEWGKQDRSAALLWFVNANIEPKIFALHDVADWFKQEPEKALALLLSAPAQFGAEGMKSIFSDWGKLDPVAAMARAEMIADASLRLAAQNAAVAGWSEKDPAAALAWFQEITDPMLREQLAPALAFGVFAKDPERAIEITRSMPEGLARNTALADLASRNLFSANNESSTALIAEIPFDPANSSLLTAYRGWLLRNCEGAIRSLLDRLDAPSVDAREKEGILQYLNDPLIRHLGGTEMVRQLASSANPSADEGARRTLERNAADLAAANLANARTLVEGLPEGPGRDIAMAGVMQSWAATSVTDAAAWLDQKPSSAARDTATSGFVRGAFPLDPHAAIARLKTIADASMRMAALEAGWRNWLTANREAAEKWRDSATGLTDAQRQRLKSDVP